MAPVIATAEIGRPAAEVFACATGPTRFCEWQKGVVDGHIDSPANGSQVPGVGAKCVTTHGSGKPPGVRMPPRQADARIPVLPGHGRRSLADRPVHAQDKKMTGQAKAAAHWDAAYAHGQDREEHITPAGTIQPFTWIALRKQS